MKRAPPKDLPEATAEAETLTFSQRELLWRGATFS
jgi:hypothetical protein